MYETATGSTLLSSDDAELTPIFHALARCGYDRAEHFRRDPLAAPIPADPGEREQPRLRAVTVEPGAAESRRPGDAWPGAHRAPAHAASGPGAAALASGRRRRGRALEASLLGGPALGGAVLGIDALPGGAVLGTGAHRAAAGAHRAEEPGGEVRRGGRHRALRAVSHPQGAQRT